MKTNSARDAKKALGLMIDTAHAEPVLTEKQGRGVFMVNAPEECERLTVRPDAQRKTVGQVIAATKK
jgi:hypothetical protein